MNNLKTALNYYQAVSNRNIATAAHYLHDEITLKSPLTTQHGKQAVLNALKGFCSFFVTLTIETSCSNTNNQIMLTYTLECPQPVGLLRAAGLLTFKDDLIVSIELFFDARKF